MLTQQQESYNLFVKQNLQQNLWYKMQMQMQTATPHHTTTAQVLCTVPSTL
jgi:hypothetical protein